MLIGYEKERGETHGWYAWTHRHSLAAALRVIFPSASSRALESGHEIESSQLRYTLLMFYSLPHLTWHQHTLCNMNAHTGLVTANGTLRQYTSDTCTRNFTLPELMAPYIAQSAVWNMYGFEKPWWSVLTSLTAQRDVTQAKKDAFYKSGANHVNHVMRSLRMHFPHLKWLCDDAGLRSERYLLDFGCGLARLSFSFATHFSRVFCVDQSVHHLRRAQSETSNIEADRSARITWVATTPDLLAALSGQRVDVVHTVISMQHTPHPLQVVFFEQLCDALRPGGIGWLHITTSTVERSRSVPCDLEAVIARSSFSSDRGMHMHTTPAAEVEKIFKRRGCRAELRKAQTNNGERFTNSRVRSNIAFISKIT